jgi:hypothetical protein
VWETKLPKLAKISLKTRGQRRDDISLTIIPFKKPREVFVLWYVFNKNLLHISKISSHFVTIFSAKICLKQDFARSENKVVKM